MRRSAGRREASVPQALLEDVVVTLKLADENLDRDAPPGRELGAQVDRAQGP
jgi:hypothetical protein